MIATTAIPSRPIGVCQSSCLTKPALNVTKSVRPKPSAMTGQPSRASLEPQNQQSVADPEQARAQPGPCSTTATSRTCSRRQQKDHWRRTRVSRQPVGRQRARPNHEAADRAQCWPDAATAHEKPRGNEQDGAPEPRVRELHQTQPREECREHHGRAPVVVFDGTGPAEQR